MESRCNACIEKFIYKELGLEKHFPTKVFPYFWAYAQKPKYICFLTRDVHNDIR